MKLRFRSVRQDGGEQPVGFECNWPAVPPLNSLVYFKSEDVSLEYLVFAHRWYSSMEEPDHVEVEVLVQRLNHG